MNVEVALLTIVVGFVAKLSDSFCGLCRGGLDRGDGSIRGYPLLSLSVFHPLWKITRFWVMSGPI